MWRHAVNGYMIVTGTAQDYLIMGPLRGGGVLQEIGWIGDVGASCTVRYAWAISGSGSPTIGNLAAATSLIQRSNDVSGVFGVPTITLPLTSAQYFRCVLPMSVKLVGGGQYLVVGIQVATGGVALHTVAWGLEIGRSLPAPGPGGMVDRGGVGVENGLER